MKITVTGGAGYIGTTLIPLLLDNGHQVRIFDSLRFGGDPILPFFRRKGFEFTEGDIRDKNQTASAVKDADVVIHLAAIVGYPACRKEPQLAEEVNVGGTKNVVESTTRQQLILFGSTGSNYGAVEDVCTEETPLNPLSLYGQTKTLAEEMLLDHRTTIAFRFATAFGLSPRLRLDLLVNDFVYKALTQAYLVVYEKHFMRTFIHVHDIARSFLFGIDNADRMAPAVFNVGSDKMNSSKEDLCNLIQEQIDFYVHYADVGEDADKRNYTVSYDKIQQLGYASSISLPEGISELKRALGAIRVQNRYTNV